MQKTGQDTVATTPLRIFPLSPAMVRRLRKTPSSHVRKVLKPKQDQERVA